MNHKCIILIIVFICCHNYVTANAFNDSATHPNLTKVATVINPKLKNSLVTFIGYTSGFNKVFQGVDRDGNNQNYNVVTWLQKGSTDEDKLNSCRASSHFHNPIFISTDPNIKDWDGSKMSDSLLIDAWCMSAAKRYSTVTFATGFRSPTGPYIIRDGQDMGWDNARTYLYEALTTTDPATKEAKFVRTFRSVGMVMHLLQDMAVPAHVRNDMSSHLINRPWWDSNRWASNPFEKYVFNNDKSMDVIMSMTTDNDKPTFSAPMRHTDFWDKDIYTGENPDDTIDQNIGLAEYANANFVSDFTIFKPQSDTKHYFKYPNEATSVNKVHYIIADPIKPSQTIKRTYYQKIKDGDVGYRLAGVGFLNRWSASLAPLKRVPPMDDYVHEDYAKKILPRAVGYSAALLDYFFRGTLNVTTTPGDITFSSVRVAVSNSTPNETMGIGDVSLVIRYKTLTETDLGGGKYLLNNPSTEYSYKVVTLHDKVDMSTPQTLTFDFSANPLPINFSDMTMQLVFKGKLGNEDGAVAVSKPEIIDGIYTDFALSLPPSGVYAKTSNDSTSATFNELRVTALTDIYGGLSGGTITLALDYRTAIGDQFQSVLVDTEPIDAAGYILKKPEKNGISTLPEGVPVELTFDLSSMQLPVQATDVEINIIYTKADGSQAIGVRDVSEPTPVDVYNNTDYSCLNGVWYRYDDPAAMAIVDSNSDGIADRSDIYPHSINNISFLVGPAVSGDLDATTSNTLFALGPLATGQMLRMGYIVTDYANRYAINETRTGQNGDPWFHPTTNNRIFPGTGFRNDATGWGMMFAFRDIKMWWGTSVIFINKEYPLGSSCTWDALNQKLGL